MATAKDTPPARSGMSRRRTAARKEQGAQYQQRQTDLRQAAAILFKERGLANVTLDDIAKSAGINRASIYYYASSKDEIFLDLTFDAMNNFVEDARNIVTGDSTPLQKLEAFIISLMDNYERAYPHLYVFMQERLNTLRLSSGERQEHLLTLSQTVDQILYDLICAGIGDGSLRKDLSPRMVAHGILGMTNWSHRWFRPGGKLSGKQIGSQFAELVLAGIKVQREA